MMVQHLDRVDLPHSISILPPEASAASSVFLPLPPTKRYVMLRDGEEECFPHQDSRTIFEFVYQFFYMLRYVYQERGELFGFFRFLATLLIQAFIFQQLQYPLLHLLRTLARSIICLGDISTMFVFMCSYCVLCCMYVIYLQHINNQVRGSGLPAQAHMEPIQRSRTRKGSPVTV